MLHFPSTSIFSNRNRPRPRSRQQVSRSVVVRRKTGHVHQIDLIRGLRCLSSRSCDEEITASSACVMCKNLVWPEILSQNESLLRRNDADCSIRRNFRQISSQNTRCPCQKGAHARRCFLRRLPRLRIVGEGDRIGDSGGVGGGGGGGGLGGGGTMLIGLTCTVGSTGTCLRKFKYRWRAATYSLTF